MDTTAETSRADRNLSGLTDEQLMAEFKVGHGQRYFEEIVSRHRERIHKFLLTRTRDSHRAEDITQEVFILAFERHAQLRGRSVVAWLLMIAANCETNDYHRHTAAKRGGGGEISLTSLMRQDAEREEPGASFVQAREEDPMTLALGDDERRKLRELVAALSPVRREAIQAVYFWGWTVVEYAEAAGISIGTASSRLGRAIEELRGCLTREEHPVAQSA